MTFESLILVLISGLGVIHGLLFGIFLWFYKRGNPQANKLLSALLFVLSFRVGKSVILEFLGATDVTLIFIGLSFMLTIGPIYFLFTKSLASKVFKITARHLLHFIPFLIGLIWGSWLEPHHLEDLSIIVFIFCFTIYYGHYLAYLFISRHYLKTRAEQVQYEQRRILNLMFYGLLLIWIVYVLNIIDEVVPYIVGPILYTIVAYGISFIVMKQGLIAKLESDKYKTSSLSEAQVKTLYKRIVEYVRQEDNFKNPDLTLRKLANHLNQSTQNVSMAVNKCSGVNFNQFVNQQRINAAKSLLSDETLQHRTIASIAMDVGFNSISSFYTAFKKNEGVTPKGYRSITSK